MPPKESVACHALKLSCCNDVDDQQFEDNDDCDDCDDDDSDDDGTGVVEVSNSHSLAMVECISNQSSWSRTGLPKREKLPTKSGKRVRPVGYHQLEYQYGQSLE